MLLGKLRVFLHMLFLENEEQTSQKKYRVMYFYSTENVMQNFRHFCKKQKNTSDCHLAWFCTQPFSCNISFCSPVLRLRERQNTLEYSRLKYVIVTQQNPRVFKAHTIHDVHLEYSYRIWWDMLRSCSFV